MEFPFEYISKSEADTIKFAEIFSSILHSGDVVALNGDLGTGKTFVVKSVAAQFGVKNSSSPSFAIVNEYRGDKKIYHFDFYRIKNIIELYDIGFEDYLNDDAIVFIEWADSFPQLIPHKSYNLNIEFINQTGRKIVITKNG